MTLRWGILATGGIAHAFTNDLKLNGLTVQAVGSRRAEAAEAFATEFGIPNVHSSYEALAADPEVDIVYIATPHPLHAENAILMLNGGKHVLVEKPFTLTGAEAAAVRDLAAEKGLLALEAMWTRYLPHMVRIREIIAAGTLGEVRTLLADHTQDISDDPSHRLNDLALGGGALLDLGIYPVSFAWDLFGAPESILADARFKATGADAQVATIFGYSGGRLATTLSASDTKGPNTASVLGTDARIDIDEVWYTPTTFRVIGSDGSVLESFASEVTGRGMHFQALAAEKLVADGDLRGGALPIDESVAIMESLDEIRRIIGLVYPSER
ncbi:Gfo/Idh/MocA family protein [Agromyces atrinae]|uniref:Gfo/Idh/MocA family oxidoreductase n=1 Tax=Agromyces atrinae TaxID=592376 RepID=A0A4Q2MA49_9MICO|nr:Gfo/Idh/MocA family oxidoreductase [Agromyces atrinae]NYD68559.1 putative dehydrogenase [Agromyces atrinae]RXZ85940.1 Gfo/Idh/MocA family oxidoreductase [Agromyces atrinae]